jgi:hypothetical protein
MRGIRIPTQNDAPWLITNICFNLTNSINTCYIDLKETEDTV